jgi:hypothetical protein
MANIINTQTNAKTFFKRVTMISSIALVLSVTMSSAYAIPPEHPESCQIDDTADQDLWQCCWTETDPSDPEQIEIYKCQHCWIDNGKVDCSTPDPDPSPFPTREEDISPGDSGVIEQPPSDNTPPIRSDNSVSPNQDSNIIDETQPNSNPPQFDQRVPAGNVGILEQLEDSSNNEQSQESQESTETNNVETASISQENDETSNSETTTSLSKRGNTQNSPVPPECPKQGPIPPDCTMKPKF